MNLKSKLTEENFYIVAGIVCVILIFPLLYYMSPRHGVKVYDCSIAEISPDYPVDVKNECRKIRADKIK